MNIRVSRIVSKMGMNKRRFVAGIYNRFWLFIGQIGTIFIAPGFEKVDCFKMRSQTDSHSYSHTKQIHTRRELSKMGSFATITFNHRLQCGMRQTNHKLTWVIFCLFWPVGRTMWITELKWLVLFYIVSVRKNCNDYISARGPDLYLIERCACGQFLHPTAFWYIRTSRKSTTSSTSGDNFLCYKMAKMCFICKCCISGSPQYDRYCAFVIIENVRDSWTPANTCHSHFQLIWTISLEKVFVVLGKFCMEFHAVIVEFLFDFFEQLYFDVSTLKIRLWLS